jgi:hypothetical protein
MKVLLACDGSNYSEANAETIGTVLQGLGAALLGLRVLEPVAYAVPTQMAQEYATELQDHVKQASKSVEQIAGPSEKLDSRQSHA